MERENIDPDDDDLEMTLTDYKAYFKWFRGEAEAARRKQKEAERDRVDRKAKHERRLSEEAEILTKGIRRYF